MKLKHLILTGLAILALALGAATAQADNFVAYDYPCTIYFSDLYGYYRVCNTYPGYQPYFYYGPRFYWHFNRDYGHYDNFHGPYGHHHHYHR